MTPQPTRQNTHKNPAPTPGGGARRTSSPNRPAGPQPWYARPGWLLFFWLVLFYTLCTSGMVYSPDGTVMGRVAYSIVHGKGLAVDPEDIPEGFLFPGTDHRLYDKYGAGLSLLAVPYAVMGKVLARLNPSSAVDLFVDPKILWYRPRNPDAAWHNFAMGLVSALLVAATCALLYSFMRKSGYVGRSALLATGVAAVASPLWPYAKDFFAEPLGGLGLMLFAWAAESMAQAKEGRRAPVLAMTAGLGLGLCALAKVAHFILFPAAGVVFFLLLRRITENRARLRSALAAIGGALIPCLIICWYNQARFGSILTTGYEWELNRWSTPVLKGLSGLLISPGRGLIPYFPAVILALASTRASYRRSPHWTIFSWVSLAVLLGFYCRWYAWSGGWCWGPRFLVVLLPFLAFLLAPFFSSPPRQTVLRLLGWAAILAGLWVAFTGTLVPSVEFHHRIMELFGKNPATEQSILLDWKFFPAWAYLGSAPRIFTLITRALHTPDGWWIACLFGVGLVWLVPLGWAAGRSALDRSLPGWSRRRWAGWTLGSLALGAILAVVSWTSGPHVVLQYDFERTVYGPGWLTEGTAFGSGPSSGNEGNQNVTLVGYPGRVGAGLVNTYQGGSDEPQGVLRSPEFVIRGSKATFVIGGMQDPEKVGAKLTVDGRDVLCSTGTGKDVLAPVRWDLTPFLGRTAQLRLYDLSSEPGGHLLFDDFRIWRE